MQILLECKFRVRSGDRYEQFIFSSGRCQHSRLQRLLVCLYVCISVVRVYSIIIHRACIAIFQLLGTVLYGSLHG